jgi:hypothetical protein
MVLYSLALEEWLAALTKADAVPDRASRNCIALDTEENREAENN